MDYHQAMEALHTEGFLWRRLRDYFPFGAVELREGNYQRLLDACLERIAREEGRERLLDLLDMQAVTFLEQCWVQDEMDPIAAASEADDGGADTDIGRFGMAAHFAAAWLQINSNYRSRLGTRRPSLMSLMHNMSKDESLSMLLARCAESTNGTR
jgi:hypothetical protein